MCEHRIMIKNWFKNKCVGFSRSLEPGTTLEKSRNFSQNQCGVGKQGPHRQIVAVFAKRVHN